MSNKKIRPNLSGVLKPNTDSNAMLKALEDSRPPAAPTTASSPAAAPAVAASEVRQGESLLAFDAKSMTTADLVVGHVYELPLSMLLRSDNNARVYYNPIEIDDMAQSLASRGQDVPAVGYVKDKNVIIVDGQKRFNACVHGKLATLRVAIRTAPESEMEEYEASWRINITRSTQTAFDDAIRWQQLLDKKVYASQEDIAQRLQVSAASVSKTLGLNRIPQALRRMMAEAEQTSKMSVAYEISNLFAKVDENNVERLEAMAEEVINTVNKKELNRLQTIELVKSLLAGPKTRERSTTQALAVGKYKGAIKTFAKKGRFELQLNGLEEERMQGLQQEIETVVRRYLAPS